MTLDGTYDNEENVHVLTRIPGSSENNDDPEEPEYRYSAVPAPFDQWFHGDFTKGWEGDLDSARSEKSPNEYDDPLPNYRIDSAIEVGFDTDGQSISGDPEVKMADPSSDDLTLPGGMAPITLEGEPGEPDNIFRNDLDGYDDGEGQKLGGTVKGPYTKVDENFSVEDSNGDIIEGVRASIILGGSDPYLQKAKEDGFDLATLYALLSPGAVGPIATYASQYFLHVATFYSFIDFAYMADGTKVVTVWDASVYPAHALYVGGDFQRENKFREGLEWAETGWQDKHGAFYQFGVDANRSSCTPFDQGGAHFYADNFGVFEGFRDGWGNHPVMEYSLPGSTLAGDESEFQDPMFPDFQL